MNCLPDFCNDSCQECPKVLLNLTDDYPSISSTNSPLISELAKSIVWDC